MWMRILCVYLTLAVAQLPAEVLTYFAVKKYGVYVEENKNVRWCIEKFGYGGSLIISHLWKLFVLSPIVVLYYDISKTIGLSVTGVIMHIYMVGVLLWDSVHDILEWVLYA